MNFAVRPMQSADLDAVLAIAKASPEAPHWTPAHFAAYFAPPESPLLQAAFVAAEGSGILGFAATSLLLDPDPAGDSRCELDSIAVRPEVRRRGAGAALLRAVVEWAAGNGARRLALEVRAGNASAIRLYERFGFVRQGVRPRYYADPEEDALLLTMPVTIVSNQPLFSTGK